MAKTNKLENVLCELDSQKNMPKHAKLIPKENQTKGLPYLSCCDSRAVECNYSFINNNNNKSYCTYEFLF